MLHTSFLTVCYTMACFYIKIIICILKLYSLASKYSLKLCKSTLCHQCTLHWFPETSLVWEQGLIVMPP